MIRRLAVVGILVLNLVAVNLVLAGVQPVAAATTHTVCATGCDFTSIQAAITAAAAGDTIEVRAGTYTEQLAITKSLTITGAGANVTSIASPTTAVCSGGFAAIVAISGAVTVTMSDLTITGPPTGLDTCAPHFFGVSALAGANLALSDSTITAIRPQATLGGAQGGTAIRIGTTGQAATATLTNLTISDYQKRGVYIDGPGSDATLSGSTITGVGATTLTAQNGVVVLNGATATISGNTIGDNLCDIPGTCGPDATQSAGLILFAATSATISNNTFSNNDYAIDIEATAPTTISDNLIQSSRYEGVIVETGDVTIAGNDIIGAGAPIGVLVKTYDGASGNAQATLTNNRITGFARGVLIEDGDTVGDSFAPTASGANNSLSGNGIGVDNRTGIAVDFAANWWGSQHGPTIAANPGGDGVIISADVDFAPWLLNGTDTAAARGFQPSPALAGAATRLVFATQPGDGQPGQPLSDQPIVRAEDADGNLGVNFSGSVTLGLGTNPSGATLGGTTSVNAVNGVATFTDLSVDLAGEEYTLAATATGPTGATSAAFDVTASPSPSPSPSPTAALTITTDGSGTGAVERDPAGTTTVDASVTYSTGTVVRLTATATSGSSFTGWRVDGTVAGQVNPLVLTMDADHQVVATFSAEPPPTFTDVDPGDPAAAAITQLVLQGVLRGYGDGTFGPGDPTLRAQMAAMIARAMGWDSEDWGTNFPDQCDPPGAYDPARNCVDPDLWRNVGTMQHYEVANGFQDGTFGPRNEVAYAQAISFITRAMVAKDHWQDQPDNDPNVYPNVTDPTHRQDIATFIHYAGRLPGTDTTYQNLPNWDQAAPRSWFALALTQAVNSYFRR